MAYRTTSNPNQMIVEGWDDVHSVVGLMKAHVDWPAQETSWPVHIHMGNGAEEILKDGVLTTYLKGSTVKIFGVMLDADGKPNGRYEAIRTRCIGEFPNLPKNLPTEGIIVDNADGRRFGVWIMPDNSSEGNLETFLRYLVPADAKPLWDHAVRSFEGARALNCPCHNSHYDKAMLYTWLAWQEPPSQSPGECLTHRVLNPSSEHANSFVTWFRELYQLPPKAKLFS